MMGILNNERIVRSRYEEEGNESQGEAEWPVVQCADCGSAAADCGGADDYITKPFSISELIARVDAVCRRVNRSGSKPEEASQIVSGPFTLNLKSRTVFKNGEQIDLTQVEYQIMEYFFKNQNTALDRSSILNHIWGESYYGDDKIVDVNIRRIRMKIEDEPSNPKYILTIWGFGYKWAGGSN